MVNAAHPNSFQPVDLVVEKNLGVGDVDVAVVSVVQEVPQQSEVVPRVFGSLPGCALEQDSRVTGVRFEKTHLAQVPVWSGPVLI